MAPIVEAILCALVLEVLDELRLRLTERRERAAYWVSGSKPIAAAPMQVRSIAGRGHNDEFSFTSNLPWNPLRFRCRPIYAGKNPAGYIMRFIVLMLMVSASTFAAGPLIVGGRAGTALNYSNRSAFDTMRANTGSRNFAVGPTLGVRLPYGLSVEGDALYNRRSLGFGLAGVSPLDFHADWWEFPVMARFTPARGAISPVVGAGVTVQHVNNFGNVPSYLFSGSSQSNSVGFVAGAGVAFRLGAVSVTPELRYTRWNDQSWTQAALNAITGGRNQAQLMVGITF